MGLDQLCKTKLKAFFPKCWYSQIPKNEKIHIIIAEQQELLYGIGRKKSYKEITDKFNKAVIRNVRDNPDIQKYIMLFDEGSPPNKEITQDKRKENNKNKPISQDEINQHHIAIPHGHFPIWNPMGIIYTKQLKRDLINHIANSVLDIENIMINDKNTQKDPNREPKLFQSNCSIIIDSIIKDDNTSSQMYLKQFPPSRSEEYRKNHLLVINSLKRNIQHNKSKNQSNNNDGDDDDEEKERELLPSDKEIGESDLKIAYHISSNPHKNFLVYSSDSDIVSVLLSNMRDWIDPITGEFTAQIWLYTAKKRMSIKEIHEKYKNNVNLNNNNNNNNNTNDNGHGNYVKDDIENSDDEDNSRYNTIILNGVKYYDKDDLIAMDVDSNNTNSQVKGKHKVNSTTITKNEKVILNVNELFRTIMIDFKVKYNIDYGALIWVLLTMFAGNDYNTSRIETVGFGLIWDTFVNGGFEILSNAALWKPNVAMQFKSAESRMHKNNSNTNKSKDDNDNDNSKSLIQVYPETKLISGDLDVIGNPNIRHTILFDEQRLLLFFRYIFQYKITNKRPTFMGDIKSNAALRDDVEIWNKQMDEKYEKNKQKKIQSNKKVNSELKRKHLVLPEDDELVSIIRRINWCMDYTMNGSKLMINNFLDPFAIDKVTQMPLWGWTRNKKTNKVELAKVIVLGQLVMKENEIKEFIRGNRLNAIK